MIQMAIMSVALVHPISVMSVASGSLSPASSVLTPAVVDPGEAVGEEEACPHEGAPNQCQHQGP